MSTRSAMLPLADLYAPIAPELEQVVRVFDAELATDLRFVEELCDTVRSYRGKMLRPALMLLSGRAAGALTTDHVVVAAVVEMVHMATLVHDDVLDDADERRRRPTVSRLSGNVAAVLLGDFLISHAFHLCSSLDRQHVSRRIGATTNVVCEGELMQNQMRGRVDLTEGTYLEIVRRKTGALTAVACELGASLAGAAPAVVESLTEFGLAAGTAFQIVDDVLDVVGDRTEMGKTTGRDLVGGKPTLPIIHCLAHAEPAVGNVVRSMLNGGGAAPASELREHLTSCGSIDYALGRAAELVERARAALATLPPSEAQASLSAMVDYILDRKA